MRIFAQFFYKDYFKLLVYQAFTRFSLRKADAHFLTISKSYFELCKEKE